ncbi:MAG: 50S ribosomal protein L14 [Euryarchaeota archaeon]|nr:50S ribosomal protein L14 [Euryarchaeota archaeon]
MKAIKASITKSLVSGARLDVVDNSGAKVVEIISVRGYRGTRGRMPKAGVGDMIVCSVKKGSPEMRKQKVNAVIIRQKKEYRRPNGLRVQFEDNAAVVTTEDGQPKGSDIKGPVAKEAAERWAKIASQAKIVI